NPPYMLGADVEVLKKHQLAGKEAKAVFGVAGRINVAKEAEKYEYADVKKLPNGRIIATLSDRKGKLAQVNSSKGRLLGVFGSENIKLTNRLSVDVGARVDDVQLTSDINEMTKYDYASGKYIACAGESHYKHNMTLGSANVGASYALTDKVNAFVSIAKADQIPADNELDANPKLTKASNRNIEVGLKGRSGNWSFDTSVYDIQGKGEVVRLRKPDGTSDYINAGKTSKKGFELSGSYAVNERLNLGGGFAYNDYTYQDFKEPIGIQNIDRSGKTLPLIPKTQTNVFAEYKHPSGVSTRLQARKDGTYYLDNANSEQWKDNKVIADLNLAYSKKQHKLDLTVDNLLDKRYAVEVSKDTAGKR
ncbi:MAG: TonB-dependent receptor, partial [Thiothrix sp.]